MVKGTVLGKVSDALEKSKEQAVPGEKSRLVGVETGRRNDARTSPLDLPASRTIEITPIDDRGDRKRDRQRIDPSKTGDQPRPIAEVKKNPRPQFDESKINNNLVAYTLPHSYEAEQFRMLRSNILFPKNGKPARSILITSISPSEGKSFVASNLAISIAQNVDKHVLLIDCDMRKPSINALFGFGPVAGLSDYLTLGHPLSSLIQKTFIDRLSILPGGQPPVNPAELLSSGRMADLLREVSQRYQDRFIIIDSPPIQLTAESKVLANFAHGVLLVTRFGRTDKKMAREVVNRLGVDKIIGVVGNFTDRKSIKKNYSDKYQGYYGGYLRSNSAAD